METVYTDYAPKGVQFYYIYKALAHPEMNGYIDPYSLEERLMHVKEAEQQLGSKVTWLCDGMDNATKHALGDRQNSEFVIDPEGKLVRIRAWSDPSQLRADLVELVGPVAKPTTIQDLGLKEMSPPEIAPRGVVPRLDVPGGMTALMIQPKESDQPYYAKLRAEASWDLLNFGSGQIYLGFFMDPLYKVHWNNLADPIRYTIQTQNSTTASPATGEGPEVEAEADMDPREFLVEIQNVNFDEPIELTTSYFACSDEEGWCKPITQHYTIHFKPDWDAGRPSTPFFGGRGTRNRRSGFGRPGGFDTPGDPATFVARLMEADANGDGKLSKDEAPEALRQRFDRMDQNSDGFIDQNELQQMGRRVRRGRG